MGCSRYAFPKFRTLGKLKSLNQDLRDGLDEQDYSRMNKITGPDQFAKKPRLDPSVIIR
jgi:hypothetical protein